MKGVLYQRSIDFLSDDYKWLWTASLFFDRVYRIVPKDCQNNALTHNVEVLCSTGEIGIPIAPDKYTTETAMLFNKNIEDRNWSAAAFDHWDDRDSYIEYCRVHSEKVDVQYQKKLIDLGILKKEDEWLYFPPNMNALYMEYLAHTIASHNDLSLYTDDIDSWTASTYYNYYESLQNGFYYGEDWEEQSLQALVSYMITNIIPNNILDISPEKLLLFREKRKDERSNFMEKIQMVQNELNSVTDKDIFLDILNTNQAELKKSVDDFRKSMDMFSGNTFVGTIALTASLSVDILGQVLPATNTISSSLPWIGIGAGALGIITGLAKSRNTPTKPYLNNIKDLVPTYLSSINPNALDSSGRLSNIMYAKLDAFIND